MFSYTIVVLRVIVDNVKILFGLFENIFHFVLRPNIPFLVLIIVNGIRLQWLLTVDIGANCCLGTNCGCPQKVYNLSTNFELSNILLQGGNLRRKLAICSLKT